MPAAHSAHLLLLLPLTLGLALLACANPLAPQAIPTVAVLPSLPPVASETPTFPVTATATPVRIILTAHIDRWYQALYPVGWQVSGGYRPNEQNFAPPAQPEYGIRVRFEGTGYSFSVLDALINSELEAMRQEGLAPQEVAIRRAEELTAGEAVGRSADFLGTVGATPIRLQVTAVIANFTAAYVIRLWAPLIVYDAEGYADAFARAVREFTPLYTPQATATLTSLPPTPLPSETPTLLPSEPPALPPSETPVSPPATPTDTATLSPTAAAPTATPTPGVPTLGAEPYRAAAFLIGYPDKWVPTSNIDGSVTFLTNDPTLLVGISVSMLAGTYNPDGDAPALLDTYLAEVSGTVPGVVVGEQRVEENAGDQARGLSATYVVPYSGGRLVYRVTTLIATADGTAYRIVQWAPEPLYEAGYRDLYRAVVAAFRPVAAETTP